ncbi:VENN motif pre-toxin domain-containing protein, partial [Dickeya chrysanthemi]|uniref:VENN motif pre-toxin domain-containing protein n=1 Tax=Dickeya chrysanthemi TaxID=556 RepID=UPI00301888C3
AGEAGGELAARALMEGLYPGRKASELNEEQRQLLSTLSTIAGGLAAGVVGNSGTDAVQGAQSAQVATENNFLNSKNVLDMNKELEEADKTGADKLAIYEKYAEISKNNREEAVAESCSGNPLCAYGALSEADAGSDIANSLNRLPIFSGLSSDARAQLDRFVLAENEDSARAIYQAMPDYVKAALNAKEAVDALGVGAAVGGKALSAFGVVGKASKQPYEPNKGAVGNMGEFFKQPGFGETAKDNSQKTSQIFQGQSVYQAKKPVGDYIVKGEKYYLDGAHKNHVEVFDSSGKAKVVLNLDRSYNESKTKTSIKEGRRLPK